MNSLREQIASLCHEQWAEWIRDQMKKIHCEEGKWVIPGWVVSCWCGQMNTLYDDLDEVDKEDDRKEADRLIDTVVKYQMGSKDLYAAYRSMARDELEASLLALCLERDQLQCTLDFMDRVVDEKENERGPTWQVFISDDSHVYTVEANGFRVEEDGTLIFLKRDGEHSYPVGVVASYSWIMAKRVR